MWWEFARRNHHIATTTNAIERLHEEFQAADRDADASAIGRHRRLHHIRRHPAKSLNRERTPSAPQVLSLAWAFITRLKGTLFLLSCSAMKLSETGWETQRVFVLGKKKQAG
jgi:hypothetical protein